MLRNLVLTALLLGLSPLCATLFCPLDTTVVIDCTFSSVHHNRIVVSRGRISKVICPEGLIFVRLEEESGQVFVQPSPNTSGPVTLSVVTDKRVVQDICVRFAEGPPEILILTEKKEPQPDGPCSLMFPETITIDQIPLILAAIENGQTPAGFESVSKNCRPERFKSGLEVRTSARLRGPGGTIFVQRVTNRSRKRLRLREEGFAKPGCAWVYLGSGELGKGQATYALIAFRKS